MHNARCPSFCSFVKFCGVSFAAKFLIPGSCTKIFLTVSAHIKLISYILQVDRRSDHTSSQIFATFSFVSFFKEAPCPFSSFTSSLPSFKSFMPLKNVTLAHSRFTINCFNVTNVSLGDFCSLTQNFTFTLCSVVRSIFASGHS
jgi:hypothetical protein